MALQSIVVKKGMRDSYETKKYFNIIKNLKYGFIRRYICQYIANTQYFRKYTHITVISFKKTNIV